MATRGCRWLAGVLCLLAPTAARAQLPESAPSAERRFAVGGEIAATVTSTPDRYYFNYTDYDLSALRVARLRLFGEWRLSTRLSLVGELRTANIENADAHALFVRWRPFAERALTIQAGRIPPIVGAFTRRAYGRDNPVLGLPLAYQYLTSLRPDAVPRTPDDLIRMRGRGWRPSYPVGATDNVPGVPLLSVSTWDTGVEGSWTAGWVELAGAATRGAPAVPVVRETNDGITWSGRAAVQHPTGLTVGLSGARGPWLRRSVLALTPLGADAPAAQTLMAIDVEYGRSRWLARGEALRTTFDVPMTLAATPTATLAAWSAFAEVRYRPHPRWQIGARADRLTFSRVQPVTTPGPSVPWDAPVDRLEGTLGFRLTPRLEVRGGWQHNWRADNRTPSCGFPTIGLHYWF